MQTRGSCGNLRSEHAMPTLHRNYIINMHPAEFCVFLTTFAIAGKIDTFMSRALYMYFAGLRNLTDARLPLCEVS